MADQQDPEPHDHREAGDEHEGGGRDAPAPPRPLARPDWRTGLTRLTDAWADRRRVASLAAAGLLATGAAVAGYVVLRTPPPPPTEATLPFGGAASTLAPSGTGPAGAGAAAAATSTTGPSAIVVHAAGAVVDPGVHRVPAGSRVADLLEAAGGPSAEADLDRVNLAAPLADGERVWFARVGEPAPPVPDAATGGGAADGEHEGPLEINRATAEELDALPGIGPAIAAAIVEHRERHGPFASVDALLDVPGIGDAKLAQLRDLVTV